RLRLVDGRDLAVQIRIPCVSLATEQALEGKPMHVELERKMPCRPMGGKATRRFGRDAAIGYQEPS
ncbi:hypothetical protein ACOTGM_25425, partial [Achromobacter xylosoxidans]